MTPEQETAVDRLDAQTDWAEICERNCIPTQPTGMTATDRWLCALFVLILAILFGDGVLIGAAWLIWRGVKAALEAIL